MARLADGDRSVFGEVYGALRPLLVALARKLLGSPADADDATQQSLVKLFERASDFDPRRDVVAWAFAICAWECRTIRKRGQRRKEVDLSPVYERESGGSPEAETIARDLERAAAEILGTLSENDRETLRAVLDDAGPAGATVRKRKERALARLRDAWRRVHGSE
jgi:RNA polymerase sigma-70 factor (ECF subfamily)